MRGINAGAGAPTRLQERSRSRAGLLNRRAFCCATWRCVSQVVRQSVGSAGESAGLSVGLCDSSTSRKRQAEIACDSLGEAVRKSRQNRSQNRPKIAPGRRPGHPKSTLRHQGRSRGVPGASRSVPGAPRERPKGVPEKPGTPQGFFGEPKRAPRRVPSRPGASKIDPKSYPKVVKTRNRCSAGSKGVSGSIFD